MYLKRLKELREDNDLKQEVVSKELKTTQQQYSRYETGKRTITLEGLIKLAKIYNTSTDYLLGLTDEQKPYPRKKINKKKKFI